MKCNNFGGIRVEIEGEMRRRSVFDPSFPGGQAATACTRLHPLRDGRCRGVKDLLLRSAHRTQSLSLSAFGILFLLLVHSVSHDLVAAASIVLEGSPTSFAQFHPWEGGPNATLEFEFKTEQREALLLYTDSPLTGDYLQLTVIDGRVRARFNWGLGAHVLHAGRELHKSPTGWHRVALVKGGTVTSIVVDGVERDTSASKPAPFPLAAPLTASASGSGGTSSAWSALAPSLSPSPSVAAVSSAAASVDKKRKRAGRGKGKKSAKKRSSSSSSSSHAKMSSKPPSLASIMFGNVSSNSYVFVGGLPSWYGEKMTSLVLPTVLLQPRLQGAVRNLRYSDTSGKAEVNQEMMAYRVSSNSHRSKSLSDRRDSSYVEFRTQPAENRNLRLTKKCAKQFGSTGVFRYSYS